MFVALDATGGASDGIQLFMKTIKVGGHSAAFAAVLLACVAVPLSGAQAVTITNGSFEAGVAISGSPNFVTLTATDSTSITGWTVSAGTIDYIGTYWAASDGTRSLDLNGLSAGTVEQTLTGLTNGNVYRIYFDMAGNPDNGPTDKTLKVTASLDTTNYTFTVPGGADHSNMGWVTNTFIFTATGSSATLAFTSTVTSGGSTEYPAAFGPALDNVKIVEVPFVAEVPLPGTLPLMLGGLSGLGAVYFGRKRRKAAA